MKRINISVVGALGYGRILINEIIENGKKYNARLHAIVDVSPIAKEKYSDVRCFMSMDDMYNEMSIDLVLIASPIQFHAAQACKAMENNSHVLLEKPIAGAMDDVDKIIQKRNETGMKILIGYQLCYDETIRKVKEIILSGELGELQSMKCIVLWPRSIDYFNRNNWAGKISDAQGRLIYDSVANNATAHYFMNLLYLAGEDMQSAASIESIDARLYRANPIETFDTCAVKAKLNNDVEFLAIASHAIINLQDPRYIIELKNDKIECIDSVWRLYKDGIETTIGESYNSSSKKIWDMVKYIRDDNYPIICSLECALEHTKMIDMLKTYKISEFKDINKDDDNNLIYVKGLEERLNSAYQSNSLPDIL